MGLSHTCTQRSVVPCVNYIQLIFEAKHLRNILKQLRKLEASVDYHIPCNSSSYRLEI